MLQTQKKLLTTKISTLNFIFTAIPTMIVCIIVFVFVCRDYQASQIKLVQETLQDNTQIMIEDINASIQKTDFIVRNVYVLDNLEKQFTNRYELMSFINSFNVFMDTMESINSPTENSMLIYTSNQTLPESKYLRQLTRLSEWKKILMKMEEANSVFLWEDNLYIDNNGTQYLKYYLNIPMRITCILEGKVKLNYESKQENSVQLTIQKLIQQDKPIRFESDAIYISEPVINGYFLEGKVLYRDLYLRFFYYFVILCIIIILVICIIYYISKISVKKMTLSISNLLENLQQNVSLTLEENNNPIEYMEIGLIRQKINDLMIQVRELNDKQRENEMIQKNLELEMLNYKINPHLLYNSLSSINLVAYKQDFKQVKEVVDIMVDYYRQVLNSGNQVGTVEEELMLTEKFIKISGISRNRQFHLSVDVSPEIRRYYILHLLFQPIVENAILHGFYEDIPYAGVHIKANATNEELIFEISDNGAGMSSYTLSALNRMECKGYGIRNTAKRIAFYYGEDCGIQFASTEGKGTTAIIRIKLDVNL